MIIALIIYFSINTGLIIAYNQLDEIYDYDKPDFKDYLIIFFIWLPLLIYWILI